MVPCTVWLLKLPQFGPTLQLGHQMVSHIVWFLKLPYFGPTLQHGPPDGPPYWLIVEMATVWSHFVIGQSNDPLYRLIVEKATFCHHVIRLPNGPPYRLTAVFGPNFSVGQQMTPIQSWLFADCLAVLFHEMGNLSFNIGGGLNGPLPFAGSL